VSISLALLTLALTTPSARVQELYEQKRYFELRDSIDAAPPETKVFFRAIIAAKFNRPDASVALVREYLSNGHIGFRQDALELAADSAFRAFKYEEAGKLLAEVLVEFGGGLTQKKRDDLLNFQSICRAVAEVPPQKVVRSGDTRLKNLEKSGLKLPVSFGGKDIDLLFDTGANISVLRAGVAELMGVRLFEARIKVGTITGNSVEAQMGWLPEIRIGNVTVSNPIFLVMSDKDLTVAPNFMLDGLIGFPIISALGELTIHKDGTVEVPQSPTNSGPQNLCLEGLQPLVEVKHGGERLTMAFDTGANTTILYQPFYNRFEDQVKAKGKPIKHRLTGVGSSTMVDAFLMPTIELELGDAKVSLKNVEVLPKDKDTASRYFYGNLGQDALSGYDSWTMNFERMSLTLR
jgi:hypothetical protein